MRKIYGACERLDLPRVYLFLHSIEFIILMWAAISITDAPILWKMAAIGYTNHMVVDIIGNSKFFGAGPLAYSLIFRISVAFDRQKLINRRYEGEKDL